MQNNLEKLLNKFKKLPWKQSKLKRKWKKRQWGLKRWLWKQSNMQKKWLRRQSCLIKNLSLSECSLRQYFLKLKMKPIVSSKRSALRIRYSVAVSRRAKKKTKFKFLAKLSYKIVSQNRTATLPSDTTPNLLLRETTKMSMICKGRPKARQICKKLVIKSSQFQWLITNKALSSPTSKLLRSQYNSSSNTRHPLWLKLPCFSVLCLGSMHLPPIGRLQKFQRRILTLAPQSTIPKWSSQQSKSSNFMTKVLTLACRFFLLLLKLTVSWVLFCSILGGTAASNTVRWNNSMKARSQYNSSSNTRHPLWLKLPCFSVLCLGFTHLPPKGLHQKFKRRSRKAKGQYSSCRKARGHYSSSSTRHRLWLKVPFFSVSCLGSTHLLPKGRHKRYKRRSSCGKAKRNKISNKQLLEMLVRSWNKPSKSKLWPHSKFKNLSRCWAAAGRLLRLPSFERAPRSQSWARSWESRPQWSWRKIRTYKRIVRRGWLTLRIKTTTMRQCPKVATSSETLN